MDKIQTIDNLAIAFLNECHAKMRYEYYAKEADKEGYKQIRDIFLETAENESEHAKRFYKFLRDLGATEVPNVNLELPIVLGTTEENLASAISGEENEASYLYLLFENVARLEGYDEIAYVFHEIAEAEERHMNRFAKLHENIVNGTVFVKDEVVEWKCGNCGYIHTGNEAPEECPACAHEREYFEVFYETY